MSQCDTRERRYRSDAAPRRLRLSAPDTARWYVGRAMRNAIAAGVAAAVFLAASPVARAEENTEWYGWQIIASDAVGLATLAVAGRTEGKLETGLAGAGVGLLAFGGAVVHVVNERDLGVAATSVAVRLFGTLLAGITLFGSVDSSREIPTGRWLLAGALFAAGLAVDWFLLAKSPSDGNAQQSFGLSFGSTF